MSDQPVPDRRAMLGRAALAVLCWGPIFDVYVTVVLLSDSHLRDPAWPVHARFHLLWGLLTPVIVGLAAFFLVVRQWQRLPGAARAAVCTIIAAWYLADALTYFVVTPFMLDGDALPHAQSHLIAPALKTVLVVQTLLAAAVGIAYRIDKRYNPAPALQPNE